MENNDENRELDICAFDTHNCLWSPLRVDEYIRLRHTAHILVLFCFFGNIALGNGVSAYNSSVRFIEETVSDDAGFFEASKQLLRLDW